MELTETLGPAGLKMLTIQTFPEKAASLGLGDGVIFILFTHYIGIDELVR